MRFDGNMSYNISKVHIQQDKKEKKKKKDKDRDRDRDDDRRDRDRDRERKESRDGGDRSSGGREESRDRDRERRRDDRPRSPRSPRPPRSPERSNEEREEDRVVRQMRREQEEKAKKEKEESKSIIQLWPTHNTSSPRRQSTCFPKNGISRSNLLSFLFRNHSTLASSPLIKYRVHNRDTRRRDPTQKLKGALAIRWASPLPAFVTNSHHRHQLSSIDN